MVQVTLVDAFFAHRACSLSYEWIRLKIWQDTCEVCDVRLNNVDAFMYASDTLDADRFTKGKADGIASLTWIDSPSATQVSEIETKTYCDLEYVCSFDSLRIRRDIEKNAEFIVFSYDIECKTNGVEFPTADKVPAILVGCSVNKLSNGKVIQLKAFTFGETGVDPVQNEGEPIDTIIATNEAEMLMEFTEYCQGIFPDVVLGFNNFSFDGPYLDDRAKLVLRTAKEKLEQTTLRFSKIKNMPTKSYPVTRGSKGFGARKTYLHNSPGVWFVDAMLLA